MLPKDSKNLRDGQNGPIGAEFPLAIAIALRQEMEASRRSVKTIARWTGASERTVQNWLGAVRGPSGAHLVALARHSAAVHAAYLGLCGRTRSQSVDIDASVALLQSVIAMLTGDN